MKKRRAETLVEFLIATLIFGVLMAGVFEFMATHTSTIARIKTRDDFMYYAQKDIDYYNATGDHIEADGITFAFDDDDAPKALTISKGQTDKMTFTFKE